MNEWEKTLRKHLVIDRAANEPYVQDLIEAQAILSYEAGEKAGIKKVVEWINTNCKTEDMSWKFRQQWQSIWEKYLGE